MEKFTKKQPIKDLKEGDVVLDIFVVKIKKPITAYKNGFFFTLVLSDSSGGSIDYKYWGDSNEDKIKQIYDSIKSDDVVHVYGRVSSYNNKLDIGGSVEHPPKVLSQEEYEADFVPGARKDIEQMYSKFESKINSITDEQLRFFVKSVFDEPSIKEKFKVHPGAIQVHHGWRGGLLQHTLEMMEYCETALKINPSLNGNLLIASTALHDIGKLEELEVTSRIKASRQGQLVGHLTMGMIFLGQKLKESGLDSLLQDKILHLVVSHHGTGEFGSPKEPMFPEAVALHYADMLSCRITEMIDFVNDNKEATEDDFMFNYKDKKNILLR